MLASFFANDLYVKVYENRFVLKPIADGARPTTVLASDPFSTQRLLVGQFMAAERALKKAVQALYAGKWFAPSPSVLVHPMEKVEGGLSEIEERALLELARGAGARKAVVWVGRELSDDEVRARLRG